MTWFGSIKMEDIEILEGIFATMTPDGWEIPVWLVELRKLVEARDGLWLVLGRVLVVRQAVGRVRGVLVR